jgi:MbtH protein
VEAGQGHDVEVPAVVRRTARLSTTIEDRQREATMANPFDDPNGTYLVLVNDEGQYSLWPAFIDVPAGWRIAQGEAGRHECLDFVERSWTDMRPRSLAAAMQAADAHGARTGIGPDSGTS